MFFAAAEKLRAGHQHHRHRRGAVGARGGVGFGRDLVGVAFGRAVEAEHQLKAFLGLAQRLRVADPFGQRFRIGTERQVSRRRRPQCIERRRALHNALRILGAVDDRPLVGRREKEDAPLVQQRVEVVQEIGGRIAVFGDEDVHAARAAYGRCGIQRKSPADQLLEMDGDAFRFVFAAQPPEVLRPLDECQHLLARSHKKVRPLVLNAPRRSPGSAYSSCLPRLSKKRVSTMPTLWSATMCSHVLSRHIQRRRSDHTPR